MEMVRGRDPPHWYGVGGRQGLVAVPSLTSFGYDGGCAATHKAGRAHLAGRGLAAEGPWAPEMGRSV